MDSKLLIVEDLGMFHADYSPCLYFSHLLLILCKKKLLDRKFCVPFINSLILRGYIPFFQI